MMLLPFSGPYNSRHATASGHLYVNSSSTTKQEDMRTAQVQMVLREQGLC